MSTSGLCVICSRWDDSVFGTCRLVKGRVEGKMGAIERIQHRNT
jgi:hypothetical protein